MRKLGVALLLTGGLVVATPGIASAEPQRPVYSQDDAKALYGQGEYEEKYCPIELQYQVFQYRPDGKSFNYQGCRDKPLRDITPYATPKWWNPWSWYNGVFW